MPDAMPFAPRLDLWHVAGRATNTLPKEYKNASIEDICRNEGWGIYRLNSDYSYLETACMYDNEYNHNARSVKLVEPGEIRLSGEDWIVTKKVRIKFI